MDDDTAKQERLDIIAACDEVIRLNDLYDAETSQQVRKALGRKAERAEAVLFSAVVGERMTEGSADMADRILRLMGVPTSRATAMTPPPYDRMDPLHPEQRCPLTPYPSMPLCPVCLAGIHHQTTLPVNADGVCMSRLHPCGHEIGQDGELPCTPLVEDLYIPGNGLEVRHQKHASGSWSSTLVEPKA